MILSLVTLARRAVRLGSKGVFLAVSRSLPTYTQLRTYHRAAEATCQQRKQLLTRYICNDSLAGRGRGMTGFATPCEIVEQTLDASTIVEDMIARRANHRSACPAPLAKIFRCSFHPNHFYNYRHPGPHGGAFRDRHERRAGDAMDAGGAADESATLRTAKSCGPDAPTLASSFAEVSARRR